MSQHLQHINASSKYYHKFVRQPVKWYQYAQSFLQRYTIAPGSRVFDIGAGAGILLHLLKSKYQCEVYGLDRANFFFSRCRILLGLESHVHTEEIEAQHPIQSFIGQYDYITSVMTCFDCIDDNGPRVWKKHDYTFWFYDVVQHLKPGGTLIAVWNMPSIVSLFEETPVSFVNPQQFTYTKPAKFTL